MGILQIHFKDSKEERKKEKEREKRVKELEYFESLIIKSEFKKRSDEPLPPWLVFPSISPFDMPWNMGPGESYLEHFDLLWIEYFCS